LDALAERIEGILRRKGQVVLYGPPGTGKTYRALAVAKDLAARRSFGRISPLLQKRSARGSRAPTVWFVSAPFIQAMVTRCDFAGLGLHTLRRANITWRQEVGGSSIEASQIAGHANSKMTGEYTVVKLRRQEELTRRLQEKLAQAGKRRVKAQK